MTTIRLHNSLTHAKEDFVPLDPAQVGMYVCGPTVYDLAHLGNARSAVAFDQMRRTLMAVYPKVVFVRNVTDIDDKIIERSAASGEPLAALTARTHQAYLDDMAALGVLAPSIEPRATDHIAHMQALIATLLAKGHAYVAADHVLFDVRSNPRAGVLSGHDLDALRVGASERVEHATYKRDQADFVLWKPSTPDLPGWDSPWGRGRPGWHIECSAMAAEYLGPVFDIHGGGHDLIFPHHENEIAQSTCAHGTAQMARVFVHNGMLTVDGRKMSKSAGNFLTVQDLLAELPGRGEALRLVFLSAHYRQALDFTRGRVAWAAALLDRLYGVLARAGDALDSVEGEVDPAVMAALADDINTPLALTRLHELLAAATAATGLSERLQTAATLRASARHLGLLEQPPEVWRRGDDDAAIGLLVDRRTAARAARDWAAADAIRVELLARGIALEDGPNGTTWRTLRD